MSMKGLIIVSLVVSTIFLAGCASIRGSGLSILPGNFGKEEGFIWCNARYLDVWAYPEPGSFRDSNAAISGKGYIYALAAGLTLQKDGVSDDKHFYKPDYLTRLDELEQNDHKSGFQASVFEYRNPADALGKPEIVVAFRGSDEWKDYQKHNLSFFPKQYKPARDLVVLVREKYPDNRLVVAGFSLGGGLAVHVANHPDTKEKVSEAWALNPSPRTGVNNENSDKVYLASVKGEILELFRTDAMGARQGNYSNNFGLVKSSSVYGHSRWVLIRQMLYFADMLEFEKSGRTATSTEPLKIILQSNVPAGCGEEYRNLLSENGRTSLPPYGKSR